MGFGQAVIGPPGSGKTTYCWGLQQYFRAISRPIAVINLDPAVEDLPYEAAIDIRELINLNEVMDFKRLGPNGSILFCLEYLENNFEWLADKLASLTFTPQPCPPHSCCSSENDQNDNSFTEHEGIVDYIVLDLPGQVELSTDHQSLKNILHKLVKLDWRLAAVQLTDSTHIVDPVKYISIVLLNLKAMLHLGLPQINVLTKIDLLRNFNEEFKLKLEFYTNVQDLSYLVPLLETQLPKKFTSLNQAIIELIEDFNLVGFETLCVEDKSSMTKLILTIDKAIGYYPSYQNYKARLSKAGEAFGQTEAQETPGVSKPGQEGMMIEADLSTSLLDEVQERWIDYPELYDHFQRQLWANESDVVLQNATRVSQLEAIQKNKQEDLKSA